MLTTKIGNLTPVQVGVWEEIARRRLAGPLMPTNRELGLVVGQSTSVIYYTLVVMEKQNVIMCYRQPDGRRIIRAIKILIWPASFGVGANSCLRE